MSTTTMPDSVRRAAQGGDVQRLRELAQQGTDLNGCRDTSRGEMLGCTALHLAALSGALDAVAYLLDECEGASLDAEDEVGDTPLFYAAVGGMLELVKNIVRRQAKTLMHTNKARAEAHPAQAHMGRTLVLLTDGSFALAYADLAQAGDTVIFRVAGTLSSGDSRYNPHNHHQPPDGPDPVPVLRWLVEQDTSVVRSNNEITGGSLLHVLIHAVTRNGRFGDDGLSESPLDLLKWLVKKKHFSLRRKDKTGCTPLHTLLGNYYLDEPRCDSEYDREWCDDAAEILKVFFELGADPLAVTDDGSTLAHWLLGGSTDAGLATVACLRMLLQKCTDKKLLKTPRPRDGSTVLQLACEATGVHAVELVGAVFDAIGGSVSDEGLGKNGGTLLHHVSSEAMVRWFMEETYHGITHDFVGKTDKAGRTVVHAAARRFAHTAVVYFVIEWSIDVNARDGTGATALHLACAHLHYEGQKGERTVSELIRLGADPLAKDGDGATPLELLNAASSGGGRCLENARSALMEAAERRAASPAAAAPSAEDEKWRRDHAPLFRRTERLTAPAGPPCATLLAGLRADGRFTDATLVCGGEEIAVHSVVLAAQSPFFEALLLGSFPRVPDGRYLIEEVSTDTLRTAVDFAYTSTLPEKLKLSAVAALLSAADKLDMPRLLAVCRVRVTVSLQSGDDGLFAVYDAAAAIKDTESMAVVERFLMTERCTDWLRKLVTDQEAWAGLCKPGSAVNGMLQSLFLKSLAEKDEGRKRKREEEWL